MRTSCTIHMFINHVPNKNNTPIDESFFFLKPTYYSWQRGRGTGEWVASILLGKEVRKYAQMWLGSSGA